MSFNNPLVSQVAPARFDPLAPVFDKVQIALFDLFRANMEHGGGMLLSGRTFRDCIIEGPAVILVLPGTRFERCNFGAQGDIRELLLKPVSENKAIGSIALEGCVFEGCRFVACGFTGHQNFLDMMINELGGPTRPMGTA